tara:strand:- start:8469 stop:8723 length:255 start_codon:yes stop_codon:yes gene_type:complete
MTYGKKFKDSNAYYICLMNKKIIFINDWKERIRSQLVNLVRNNESNNIIPNKKRNSVYKNVPLHGFFQIEKEENWSPDAADPYA